MPGRVDRYCGKTVVDKVVGILLPIAAFVACGFEHCVANMYFCPWVP
ncbi:MAG: formate/nitrite transporter family protein [Collinsella aerofaciens]